MSEVNKALFKQALRDGVSNRIDKQIADCTETVSCSLVHKAVMKKILSGTYKENVKHSRINGKVIAILIAAALLLSGCAIVYRNQIREFFEEIYETFVMVNYSDGSNDGGVIEDAYELTYLPEGYLLTQNNQSPIKVSYTFENSAGGKIIYEQRVLVLTNFYADIESGYNKVMDTIDCYELYCKNTKEFAYYMWNDGKYTLRLTANVALSKDELKLIIEGIK